VIFGISLTEAERRQEFVRFLQSKRAHDVVSSHFISFLESERKEEFARFLGSEKTLDAVRRRFISFLNSDEGKRLLVNLLIEALAHVVELAPILHGAETRLKNLAAEQVARFSTEAEMALEASAAGHAEALKREAREAAQKISDRVKQDVRDHLSSYQTKVREAVEEQILFREEIARLLRSKPMPRSNREIARVYRVSKREVKRRRRAALGSPEKGR
jgi:hypothetical protein